MFSDFFNIVHAVLQSVFVTNCQIYLRNPVVLVPKIAASRCSPDCTDPILCSNLGDVFLISDSFKSYLELKFLCPAGSHIPHV